MDELEEKINELGMKISRKKFVKKYREGEGYCPGGCGANSFNDAVEYKQIPVYGWRWGCSREERINARGELLDLLDSLDEKTRELIKTQFKKARHERLGELYVKGEKVVRGFFWVGASLGVLYFVHSCISK